MWAWGAAAPRLRGFFSSRTRFAYKSGAATARGLLVEVCRAMATAFDAGSLHMASVNNRPRRAASSAAAAFGRRKLMGKYVLAWLLGVPAFVLVIIYFFAH